MASLSRTESEARAAGLKVHDYHVELDLSAADRFRSISTITFTARTPQTFVDVVARELVGAQLDGHPVDLTAWERGRLSLERLGGRHVLRVEAWMAYSHDGEGLHRFVDPADGEAYLYAMSFLDAAPRWFACFDQPDLKASLELELICPPDWTVLGNGPARQHAPGRWHVDATPPIATYTMTVVAGPYYSVRSKHDGVPLGLHTRRSLAAELDRDAAALLELTANSFDAYHRLFGVRYPFGEYHQAFVPEFNAGAMENPGCVTFRDQMMFRSRPSEAQLVSRAITVVHEMAHMWFGDLVTMRWWDDLWLNESFADYLSHRVTAEITDLPAWELFGASAKAWGYDADRRRSTHPVAGNGAADSASALNDFDGISYAKGAALLRQLVGYLGDEMFLGGLRQHITAHAYGNATFADLLAAWTDHAGPGTPDAAGLANWAEQWLRRAGVDPLTVAYDDGVASINRGRPEFGPPAERPHAITVAALGGPEAPARRTAVTVAAAPEAVLRPGVLVPNAGDESWATVRLAPGDWCRLPELLPVTGDPVLRVVVWNALRAAVADGLVPVADAVATLAAGLPAELDIVASRLWPWGVQATARYLPPGPARATAQAQLATTADEMLTAAPPGSSAQLTAARAVTATSTAAGRLARWSTGTDLPPGLALDEDLRWQLLLRRSALGHLGPDDIDAALADEPTSTAALGAARCHAARPDPAAKSAAWSTITSPDGHRSQYELMATAEGIFLAGQEDIWAPFVTRWFEDLVATAAFRTNAALAAVATASFPHLAVHARTVERAEALLTREDLPPGLRRVVADATDDLRRAVAVRPPAS